MKKRKWQEERIGNCRMILADYRDVIDSLPPIDLLFTSPPYGEQRDYNERQGNYPPRRELRETMEDKWRSLMSGIQRVPGETTQVLINLGMIRRKNEVMEYWEGWKQDMRDADWKFFDMLVWDQGSGFPGDWRGRLAPSYELIFHFNKKARTVNKWVRASCIVQVRANSTKMKKKDGTPSIVYSPEKSGQPLKTPDNVIRVGRGQTNPGARWHPAVFPIELPTYIIRSFSDEGQTVFDPFMGSGTTATACIEFDRSFIGCEIDKEYFVRACELISKAERRPSLIRSGPAESFFRERK